jgi:hypothetical protein
MALALTLFAGFALGSVSNIFVLGIVGSAGCTLAGLLMAPTEGAFHAMLTAALHFLVLQIGFGAALAAHAARARLRHGRGPADAAPPAPAFTRTVK